MRWVANRRDPVPGGEHGMIAIVIAISLTVLFGVAALVIDGGALAQERRELQNGADAGALALAELCAIKQCPGSLDAAATSYAGFNAADGKSRASATRSGNSVRVVTRTLDTEANVNEVDFRFAPAIGGGSGNEVTAAATAAWAGASGGTTLPLTFSLCEWDELVSAGGVFSTTPKTIYFHKPTNPKPGDPPKVPCSRQPGQDQDADSNLNGGFGWLEVKSGRCEAIVTLDGWAGVDTGVSTPNECNPADLKVSQIYIPVFDRVVDKNDPDWASQCSGKNVNRCYHIYGFATFKVTGFRFPGNGWTWNAPCNPPDTCIAGVFLDFTVGWTGQTGGGTDLGTYVVFLTE